MAHAKAVTGAELLLRTAASAGVDACFANPGTTELGLVNALDVVPAVRAVLCQFEGVCSGAADGYGRMADRPALALFHLGPGLANGIANLHNARRGHTPVVALVGDHATWHRAADAPLTSDIESLARPVSRFVRTATSAAGLGRDVADAIASSTEGGVATLIVPSDCQTGEAAATPPPVPRRPRARVPADRVERAAAALRGAGPAALFLGGAALREGGTLAAARAAQATGARLVAECFPARMERGAGLPAVERIPYFPERAAAALAGLRTLVLAGAPEPVAFFGYPGQPSRFAPEGCEVLAFASPEEDVEAALDDLADALAAPPLGSPAAVARQDAEAPVPEGALTPAAACALLARMQPEGAIVVDESATTGLGYFRPSASSPRHTLLALTGGSIGMGPPCATGAALACPDRTVIDFQGDGSAMYTLQALWTQAREGLHVVTLLCNNRSYRILEVEQQRAGAHPGPRAASLTDLGRPPVDWVLLARGMGVAATRVDSAAALRESLGRSLAEPGPHLIEMMV
jgi:acetolactate synthase I/II/III large subunit